MMYMNEFLKTLKSVGIDKYNCLTNVANFEG